MAELHGYLAVLRLQCAALEAFLRAAVVGPRSLVVMDIDETCLMNLAYVCDDLLGACMQYDGRYPVHTGLTPLLREVAGVFEVLRERGIAYAFVTARRDSIRALTENNLELEGLGGYVALHTRPDDDDGCVARFKQACRARLARTHDILCCVGDQVSDVSGAHTGVPFLLFNPFYVSGVSGGF